MEQKYEKIEFGKLSEAIAYLEDGGYLCQLDGGHAYEIDDYQVLTIHWREPLFTKAKPKSWYEKLDGTVENGVLCRWPQTDGVFLCVSFIGGTEIYIGDDYSQCSESPPKPLTRSEIQRFMDNAPD